MCVRVGHHLPARYSTRQTTMILTWEKTHELATVFLNAAKEQLSNGNEIIPTTFLVAADEKLTIICTPWTDSESKHIMENMLKVKIIQENSPAVIRIADAWVNSFTPGVGVPLMPRRDPDREEAILVSIKFMSRLEAWTTRYTRDPINFKETVVMNTEGKMTDYFWQPNAPRLPELL